VLYGAFATAPILLIWIYVAWVIALFGAVIAAYLPSLLAGVARRGDTPGWPFQLAVEALQLLDAAHATPAKGLGASELVVRMRVDALQLAPVLETLVAIDWIAPLAEEPANEDPRYVLLADPEVTPLAPLLTALLLPRADALAHLWHKAALDSLCLRDALVVRDDLQGLTRPSQRGRYVAPARP
jgi:membrane protein